MKRMFTSEERARAAEARKTAQSQAPARKAALLARCAESVDGLEREEG
jgi:hypothetical protein